MRVRTIVIAVLSCCALVAGNGAVFASSGTPEINRANATMNLTGTYPSVVSCTGEDTINYRTYRAGGPWTGPQTEVAPDPADYALSGALSFTNIVWTINLNTQRGVYRATATLRTTAGAVVYTGPLTLITQGVPAPKGNLNVYARGWLSAHFAPADDTVAPPGDDYLLANVQFKLDLGSAQGEFGTAPAGFGAGTYAVVTNVTPASADGVC